ncbi:MAG: metal ABC transporter permease [Caldimicrobium sp.]|nr:metal ABC transporter permease [Caldimicrobium sp.]MCX7612853.1 metal ABC transporter permease [Caldimicrobium sp.]MDW8183619.1 metal ABC transporter permease [Caldimicrobium sp.]
MMESIVTYLDLFKWGLLAGGTFALSSSFTSTFLVLKRNALFPHALTHLLLFSLICLTLLSSYIPNILHFPFLLLITLMISGLIHIFKAFLKLYEDSATSLTTHLFLGLALFLASISSQYDATLLNYLFGSLIMVDKKDAIEGFIVLTITIFIYKKHFPLWLTSCIDREIPGLNFKRSDLSLLLLVTLQILIGVKLMGVLLVSSFYIFGTAFALRISPAFRYAIPTIALLNILALAGGFFLSIFLDIPFSASAIIFMSLYLFGLFLLSTK